jgi:hypothetical protein
MATVNLGAIKFNWKGAYNNSTSYLVDDVVSSSGSSYVCILASQGNAVSNGTYWNIMSSAGTNGTNGTDLSTTLTTRGDIVFKGASALTRLPKGTAGYYLKQGANDPEWGAVSAGGLKQTVFAQTSTMFSSTSDSYVATPLTGTITPTSSSSKIVIFLRGTYGVNGDSYPRFKWYRSISGGASGFINTEPTNPNGGNSLGAYLSARANNNNEDQLNPLPDVYQDSPNTTSAVTYTLYGVRENSGEFHINTSNNNAAGQQNDYNQRGTSTVLLMETGV